MGRYVPLFRKTLARCVLFVLFLTAFQIAFAQQPLERHLLKLNIVTPGLTYEAGLYENLSLNLDGLLNFTFAIEDPYNNGYPQTEGYFIGFLSGGLNLQYYFNREKRENRGRSVYGNSGMFIGPAFMAWGRDLINTNRDYVYLKWGVAGGAVWGFQRTWNNNLNIALYVGPGLAAVEGTTEQGGFIFLNKFTFGYVFFSKPDKNYKKPLPDFSPDDY